VDFPGPPAGFLEVDRDLPESKAGPRLPEVFGPRRISFDKARDPGCDFVRAEGFDNVHPSGRDCFLAPGLDDVHTSGRGYFLAPGLDNVHTSAGSSAACLTAARSCLISAALSILALGQAIP
jgi:hypothetical protein